MRQLYGKIEGPFLIDKDLEMHGMITVSALVRGGVRFILLGMVTGDLTVERGACAIIHGTVNGVVINHGGHVEIFGAVDAVADRSPQAVTVIDPAARVKGLQWTR